MPDPLGVTHIQDISPTDHVKVRSLALLELSVTFDDNGIPLRPQRPAKIKNVPGTMTMCTCVWFVCVCAVCVCGGGIHVGGWVDGWMSVLMCMCVCFMCYMCRHAC